MQPSGRAFALVREGSADGAQRRWLDEALQRTEVDYTAPVAQLDRVQASEA